MRRLEGVPGVAGIELNLSCGGGGRGGVVFAMDADAAASRGRAVRRATDLPVIAKLSAAAADVRAVARAVEAAGADAISAINTLPGFLPCGRPAGPGPRQRLRRDLRPGAQARRAARGLRGGPGRGRAGDRDRRGGTLDDVLDLLACGASAVGVGVAALADPMLPVRLADELADACRARGVAAVADLVGTALPARAGAAVDARRRVRALMPAPSFAWLLAWLVVIIIVTAVTYAYGQAGARSARARGGSGSGRSGCSASPAACGGAWLVFFGMRHKTLHRSFWVVQAAASVLWAAIVAAALLR